MRVPRALSVRFAFVSAFILAVGLAPAAAVVANPAGTGTPGYVITPIAVPPNAFSVAVDESTDMVYATESYDHNLSVIDGATGAVTASIPLGMSPAFTGAAVDPATDMVYVAGTIAGARSGNSVVKVVSGATDSVVATVTLPDGSLPGGMAVNPVTDTIYVAENTQSAIAVIDGATNTVAASVNLGYHTWPDAVAVDSTTNMVYVTNNNSDALSVVDGATSTLADTVAMPAGAGPSGVAVDAATDTIYVDAYGADGGIVRVDGSTDKTTGEISGAALGVSSGTSTYGLAWDPAREALFASATYPGSAGITYVISGPAWKVTSTIPAGGQAIAVDSSTAAEYIARGTYAAGLVAVTNGISPVITSPASATLTAGRRGSFAVTATGTPAPVFSEAGRLPRGVGFSASGLLSGTPARFSGGSYRVTITATNAVKPAAVQTLTITVEQAPSIRSAGHATFRAGRENSFTIASRGYPTAVLSEAGRLPHGIRFLAHQNGTATLSGVPAPSDAGAQYVFRIIARNGTGKAASQRFTLIISGGLALACRCHAAR